MRRFIIYTLVLGVIAGSLSSCTIKQKQVPLAPINAQVNFDMDDLEYLGDVTGTATQSYLLGLPYGSRKYHSGALLSQGGLGINLPIDRGYNNAMYDALMQKPDADLVLPVSFETITEMQFLGRKVNLTVRCKAFRIKSK